MQCLCAHNHEVQKDVAGDCYLMPRPGPRCLVGVGEGDREEPGALAGPRDRPQTVLLGLFTFERDGRLHG